VLGKCLAPNRGSIPRPATSHGLFHPTRLLRDAFLPPLIAQQQPTPRPAQPTAPPLDHESRYGGTAGPPAHLTRHRAMQQPTPRDGNDWGADNPTVSLGRRGAKQLRTLISNTRAPSGHSSMPCSFSSGPLDDASHWRGCFASKPVPTSRASRASPLFSPHLRPLDSCKTIGTALACCSAPACPVNGRCHDAFLQRACEW
jgi:hypothetical protein